MLSFNKTGLLIVKRGSDELHKLMLPNKFFRLLHHLLIIVQSKTAEGFLAVHRCSPHSMNNNDHIKMTTADRVTMLSLLQYVRV